MHNAYKPRHSCHEDQLLLTDWVRPKVRSSLPYSCADSNKIVKELFRVHSKDLEMIDAYSNYHQSFKWTELNEHIAFEISQLAMRYMPTFRTNYSPFQRQTQERKTRKNPSLTGHSSTSSMNSNSSSSSEGEDSTTDEELSGFTECNINQVQKNQEKQKITLESLLPPMKEVYGCSINNPSDADMNIYKKYVQMGKLSSGLYASSALAQRDTDKNKLMRSINLKPLDDYGTDSYLSVKPPIVDEESLRIYAEYCEKPRNFNAVPKFEDSGALYNYIQML